PTVTDARLTGIAVPATLREGEQYEVSIGVDASAAGQAQLTLTRDGANLASQTVTLTQGPNTFTFPGRADAQGFITFRAQIAAQGDTVAQNNGAESLARVYPRPRILVVEAERGASNNMRAALVAAGVEADARIPTELPARLSALAAYDALV